ncbi:MAG: cupin domain-containing protein [Thermodesulfobacteriota bacterium]|nr:cupin domain-containing protein [Thermodesulfobacteriota bacterium]
MMKIFYYKDIKANKVEDHEAIKTKIRTLISEKDGARNFIMRLFEIEPGGHTPLHKHPWEHEVFIKEGEGVLVIEKRELPLKRGDVIFILPGELHQFKNNSGELLEILCLIPVKK